MLTTVRRTSWNDRMGSMLRRGVRNVKPRRRPRRRRLTRPPTCPELPRSLQSPQERQQIGLLLRRERLAGHEAEELDRVLEGEQAPVVQVGRALLDATQRE